MTDLVRARIDYDPRQALAKGAGATLKPSPIPWPARLAPTPQPISGYMSTDPMPTADALVVTYTTAEGYALADVMTPGLDSTDWVPYRNGWGALLPLIQRGAPSLAAGCAARWALTSIGSKKVVVVKSELHPSTDGPKLPMVNLWQQMVAQVRPGLVITTGTAGGIGAQIEEGDVVVSTRVRWDCKRQFAGQPFAHAVYESAFAGPRAPTSDLLAANAAHLSAVRSSGNPIQTWSAGFDVITTDFFAMDTANDYFGLRALDSAARAVEMDDAACAMALVNMPSVQWISIRNASDPQMSGSDIEVEEKQASAEYEKFGYWTTLGSVITCWSVIAGGQ